MKCTIQLICSSWLSCNPTDVTYYRSIKEACEAYYHFACDSRYWYPDQTEALLWFGSYKDVTDIYPDYRLYVGPRGGIKKERC
jgi:hypothetical protein